MRASIIIPIQVASDPFVIFLEHLSYSLYSATKQTVPCEIVIVDYNSAPSFVNAIKEVVNGHALYVRDDRNDTLWSRGRALNVGIKYATGDLLLFVDADCVLPTNYVAAHLALIDATSFTISEFYLTAPTITKTGCYETLIAQKRKLNPPYATCCSHQGVLQETIRKVGMFDEAYRGWGAEEHDFIYTLKRAGVRPRSCAAMPIHLYHPTWHELMRQAGRDAEQKETRAFNKARYFNYASTGKK
jgi:predicted glycosyltransferase involved in capsule biosynthesis